MFSIGLLLLDNEGYNLFEKNVPKFKKRDTEAPTTAVNEDLEGQKLEKHDTEELEEMESYGENKNLSRMAYWKNALKWARDTLVYRDLFTQLTRECASLVGQSCSIRDDIIIISLFDSVMLKIEKCESPFVVSFFIVSMGDSITIVFSGWRIIRRV